MENFRPHTNTNVLEKVAIAVSHPRSVIVPTNTPCRIVEKDDSYVVVLSSGTKKKKQTIRPSNYKPEQPVKEEVVYAPVNKISSNRKDKIKIYDPLDN